jgi:pimeloyl-ACP methyl ester carboxylesterase
MEMNERIQVLLLPGLGGDRRTSVPQQQLPYDVVSCDLIEMFADESIERYAIRFGEHLLASGIIDPSRPLVLGGYSFGSAVAEVLSSHLPCRALLIIGGIRHGAELRGVVHFVGRRLALHLPNLLFNAATPIIRLFLRSYTKLTKSDVELCTNMYRNFSRSLFRRAYHALSIWRGCEITVPTLRIHGAEDQIVRPPAPSQNVLLVPTAKHLVNFSARETVNRAIVEFVDSTMRDAS